MYAHYGFVFGLARDSYFLAVRQQTHNPS